VVAPDDVYTRRSRWPASSPTARRTPCAAAKEAIDRGLDVDLDTGLEIERVQFSALFATEDRTIGMQSFIEKGPGHAQFQGR
jgi:enoyl-CoA hydratase/carnithine racemase